MMNVQLKWNRRKILACSVAAGSLGVISPFAQAQNAQSVNASSKKVTVTLNGMTYTYPGGPQIPSYYVGFRQDGRVVFHLGSVGALNAAKSNVKLYHLGAHHVRIEDEGKIVFDSDIPRHWWNSQWTYRPQPLRVIRSPAKIVASRRMFSFGDTGLRVGEQHNYTFQGPMDSAGITKYMPTTGERPDIGLITDNSAYFMMGGNSGSMFAWAQANGSFPLHYRDEATGKPVDLLKYPQANNYDDPAQGLPWFDRYPRDAQGNNIIADGMVSQQAHFPEMAYVAYLASGDLGFLEDVQYNANFTVLCDAIKSTPRRAIVSGELRGLAWAFRNLFMAHAATQDAESQGVLPSACHPSSYWKALLDNQLAYYTTTYKNDPKNQYYRLVSGGPRFGPWQVDYMLSALAFGVLTGHSDWAPLYLWALKNVIDRTNGTSGYPVGWGGAYYLNTYEWGKDAKGGYDQNQYDLTKPLDWYGTFLFQANDPNSKQPTAADIAALKADPLNGGKAMTGGEYLMTTRAVLVMAQCLQKLGIVDVKSLYPELDTCVANVNRMLRAGGGGLNARTAVVS